MGNIIYLEIYKYDQNIKKNKIYKEISYYYKYLFNIITKKIYDDKEIWILPIKKINNYNKVKKILKKLKTYEENIYILEKNLKNKDIYAIMDEIKLKYNTNCYIKKILLDKVLKFICKIQKKSLKELEVTFLVNDNLQINYDVMKHLSLKVKNVKIVSNNIYKFKNLEEDLYDNKGIAIQFSNSYRKSLSKSRIIINLDFDNIFINEYVVYNNAIIINCTDKYISIKDKLFNGVIINSYNIDFNKNTNNKINILNNKYNNLDLLESIILSHKINYEEIDEKNVIIKNLIGKNGEINNREFAKKS